MIRISTTLTRFSVAVVVGAPALFWNGTLPMDSQASFVSSAEARVGRPLTPVSYAGVARRTTRRAVAVGAAGAVAVAPVVVVAPAPVVVAPRCGQAVDAYGRIVTVCR
jgi:hypothetical protein